MNQQVPLAEVSQQPASRYMDDEIDLMELFVVLFRGWKLVAGAVLVCLVCAVAYIKVTPVSYSVALEIKPISKHEQLKYGELSAGPFVKVGAGELVSSFIADLEGRETLIEAVEDAAYFAGPDGAAGMSEAQSAVGLAYSLALVPPTSPEDKKAKVRKLYWTLEGNVQNLEGFKRVAESAFKASESNVKTLNQEVFNQKVALYKLKQTHKLEDIHIKYDALLAEYDDKIVNRLSFLKEQGEIARHLGIAKNAVEAQEFAGQAGGGGAMIANFERNPQFYMRGYKAIDKELELVDARKDKESHIDGVIALRQQLRAIESDKTIERAQQAFDASPLASGDFSAVSYDLRAMTVKSSSRTSLILALSVVLGGMLGVFAVFIRQGFRSYQARQVEQV